MSLIHIDSFGRYFNFTDDPMASASVNRLYELLRYPFAFAGYAESTYQTAGTATTLRATTPGRDPIAPERPALNFIKRVSATSGFASYGALCLPMSPTVPIVFGFSLYVPSSPRSTDAYLAISAVSSVFNGSAITNVQGFFHMGADGRFVGPTHTASPQSPKVIELDRRYLIEVRYDPATRGVMVWCDDELVLQHVLSQPMSAISMVSWLGRLGTGSASINELSASVANFYVVSEDNVFPNSRLGSSVRVLPGQVVSDSGPNEFTRPSVFMSNAAASASPLDSSFPVTLSGSTLPVTDMYNMQVDPAVAQAGRIVAVQARAMNTNISEFATLTAQLKVQGESGAAVNFGQSGQVVAAQGFQLVQQTMTINPLTGEEWTVDDFENLKVGITVNS